MIYTFADWKNGGTPPKGWDCADAISGEWSSDQLVAFMRATVKPWSPPTPPAPPEKPETAPVKPAPAPAPVEAKPISKPEAKAVAPVRKAPARDVNWAGGLVNNDKGTPKPGAAKNWSLYMENHPDMQGVFAWDAFKLRVTLMRCPPWEDEGVAWEPRALTDRDYCEAVMWLEGLHFTPKVSNIAPIIQAVAERNSFDRLLEYLDGLVWDKTPRVHNWMTPCLGVDDTAYNRTVGIRWLVSSVARGLHPGCKVDTMPILEGPQGLNKSTAVKALYGADFFSDNLSDIGGKDALMELQGVWGLEVAEMHRFSAAETNSVKKFLSRDVDRYRPPYGRSVIEAPRRVVMVGTINPEGNAYLRDPTGARRFWPITCGAIDINLIKADRDQLWAEAVHLFKTGTPWWVQADETEAVEAEQEKRTDIDVWTALIAPLLRGEHMLTQWFIFEKLGIAKKDADHRHAGRVGRIMKKFGWEMARDRQNGEDCVVFRNPKNVAPEPLDPKW